MSLILDPNSVSTGAIVDGVNAVTGTGFNYTYPDDGAGKEMDLRPGSDMHNKLLTLVMQKTQGSQTVLERRFSGWKDIDRTLTAYMESDKGELDVVNQDNRKPTTMVVPVSYATMETLLTYMVAAFGEDPTFRYEGAGPEDTLGGILLELTIAQQCRRSKVLLDLHTMWRDSFAYGFGVGAVDYINIHAYKTVKTEINEFDNLTGKDVPTGNFASSRQRVTMYSGNTLHAIDPYMCLPDPDVPIHRVQDGEFFGYVDSTNLMSLLDVERSSDGAYFNVKYLKEGNGKSKYNRRSSTGREQRQGTGDDAPTITKPVDIINMYIKLIPKDYGLGPSEYPEKWLISVAGDKFIVRAQPLGLDHDQFPISVVAPDYDGHSITPISRLETVYELQKTMDWLFKSHIANVRKAINDMLVVDPQLVNIFDLERPKPGKLIRLRRQAWGRGVKDAVMQLGVADVTRGHIADTGYITQIIRETTGAQDAVSGIRRHTSERVSAAEAQQTARGALSRLEKSARIAGMQAHQDIAYQMAFNTQQLMSDETFAKIIGEWGSVLAKDFGKDVSTGRIPVSPKDIDIRFDVVPHDGSIPHSGDPNMWIQLFQVIAGNPLLAQQIDLVRVFKYGARMAGAKNLDDFIMKGNVQVMPDEQVAQQVQQGNLTPMPPM
jgi:hypothetical protein